MANTKKFWNSRRCSKPITDSTSADTKNTPAMGDCPCCSRLGANSAVARICVRRSGEAPTRNQTPSIGENATCICERGRAFSVLSRMPAQFAHVQFHCGNPPPAADPNILICMNAVSVLRDVTAGQGGSTTPVYFTHNPYAQPIPGYLGHAFTAPAPHSSVLNLRS